MLVVVAIISLLLALLLPSLGMAREGARRSICASNQRQIYSAAWSYALDSQKKLPQLHRQGPGSKVGDHVSWTSPLVFDEFQNKRGVKFTEFTCPNRGDEFIKLNSTGWRIGYYLIFGRDQSIWSKSFDPWNTAQTINADPKWILSADIVERNTITPSMTSGSHGSGGRVEGPPTLDPDQLGSQGSIMGLLDGSAAWVKDALLKRHPASSGGSVQGFW